MAAEQASRPASATRRRTRLPLGVNYYPTDTEAASDWYAGDVAADFAAMRALQFQLVRVFVSWRLLEPQVGQYSDEAFDRLARVLELARANQLKVIVCLFGDDRHSDLLGVAWGTKRDPRTDAYLVQREIALAQKVVARFRSEVAVFAWDLANESFCTGFAATGEFERWVSVMRDAVREIDTDRPVMISVDPETLITSTGVDARVSLAESEFSVSHATALYRSFAAPGPLTSGQGTYLDAFLLRNASTSVPTIMDDVGVFSLEASHAEEAAHLRTALWSGLMNGASAALLRRWRDFVAERREPYSADADEAVVGVYDASGQPKAALKEALDLMRVAARLDSSAYDRLAERTAILVPAERFEPLPNLARLVDPRACLAAFSAAKEAHVPVALAHEGDELTAWSVLVVPSAHQLDPTTWAQLTRFVQGGGSLVVSHGVGEAHPVMGELFGVQFMGDDGPRQRLECRVAQPDALGPLESFEVALALPGFARIGLGGSATVVATDAAGSPLVTSNQFGQGRAVYLAAPLERAIALAGDAGAPAQARAMLRIIYGAVARSAGCAMPLECDAPDVELALFRGAEDDVLLALNHAPEQRSATIRLARPVASVADVRGGDTVATSGEQFAVEFGPNGTAALRLTYA